MTTTGKDDDNNLYGDVQEVEYFIVSGTGTGGTGAARATTTGGDLVRNVTRDLLDTPPQSVEQRILPGVQSMQVYFFDGTTWQTSWNFNTADSGTSSATTSSTSSATSSAAPSSSSTSGSETLPLAIRVDIQQVAATAQASPPPEIEVTVPWTVQPFASATPSASASP